MSGRALFFTVVACLFSAQARAEPSGEPWAVRLELGAAVPTDHLQPVGLGGHPPPGYLGLTLERSVLPRLVLSATGGAGLSVGWVARAIVRYALIDTPNARVSLGAGPMLLDDVGVGTGLLASADVVAEACPDTRLCVSLGINEALFLNRAGTPGCGIDACNAYFEPGDRVFTLRFGIGYRF